MKTNKLTTKIFFALFIILFSLFIGTCDLFMDKPEGDVLSDIDDAVNYQNAPFANVSIGIISGSLSATPTEAPREKVGYPFTVRAAANMGYGFAGWRVLALQDWNDLNQADEDFEQEFVAVSFAMGGQTRLLK